MLRLARVTGRRVVTADGREVGDLQDLTVRFGDAHPLVHRLRVGSRHRSPRLVDWVDVEQLDATGVVLRAAWREPGDAGGPTSTDLEPEPGELYLTRDVLDTQVVDVAGRRVARVGDVLLSTRPDSRLEVVAVDVGLGSVVRRLGLDRVGSALGTRAVDWPDLHLTSDRGHAVQLATPSAAMHRLDAEGLAHLLTALNLDDATEVIEGVGTSRAAAALSLTHPEVTSRLLLALEPDDAGQVLSAMPEHQRGGYADLVRHRPALARRRFRRLRGWRRHRPDTLSPAPDGRGA